MNKQEFKEVMEGLKLLYGDKIPDMNGFAREIWFECLSDMDFDKTKKAIINHIKASKFPPTVADIREQYRLIIRKCQNDAIVLRDLFNEMRNYYPGGSNDGNAEGVLLDILQNIDREDWFNYTTAIKNTVIDYVKRCEIGADDMRMTLSECIKWAGDFNYQEEEE